MEAAEGRAEGAEATEAPVEGTTSEPTEPVAGGEGSTEAPSSEGGDEGLAAPFKLEDVPEEQRPHVEALDRQYKAEFTRKTQELAERAERFRELEELTAKLESDDGAAALDELAEKYGFFRPEPETAEDGEDPYAGLPEPVADRLRSQEKTIGELKGTAEELAKAKLEQDREGQLRVLRSHIGDAIKPLQERAGGLDENGEQLVILSALQQPMGNGLPNAQQAVAMLEAHDAKVIANYLESKKGSPPPDTSGSDGVSRPDHSTSAKRREHAETVAARHYVES